jgi:hypothetical protein
VDCFLLHSQEERAKTFVSEIQARELQTQLQNAFDDIQTLINALNDAVCPFPLPPILLISSPFPTLAHFSVCVHHLERRNRPPPRRGRRRRRRRRCCPR